MMKYYFILINIYMSNPLVQFGSNYIHTFLTKKFSFLGGDTIVFYIFFYYYKFLKIINPVHAFQYIQHENHTQRILPVCLYVYLSIYFKNRAYTKSFTFQCIWNASADNFVSNFCFSSNGKKYFKNFSILMFFVLLFLLLFTKRKQQQQCSENDFQNTVRLGYRKHTSCSALLSENAVCAFQITCKLLCFT